MQTRADATRRFPGRRCGNIRRPSAFRDTGIKGLRSIAVDYSGRCGAPCLLAIVDFIRGGKRKVWTWQLGGIQMYGGERRSVKPGRLDRGDLDSTKVAGSTFTVTKPDATLRGTFVAPARLSLKAETRVISGDVWFKSNKQASKGIKMHCNGVFAESPDPKAEGFFVVVTMGRGPPPAVKVEGSGLQAKATVGTGGASRRTIRFDGEKIVLGE